MAGALKTYFVFHWGKIPVKTGLMPQAEHKVSTRRPYAPDTREVCSQGPSRALWYLSYPIAMFCTEQNMAPGSEIGFDRFCQAFCRTFSHFLQRECICHRSSPLHCAVTAGAGLLPFTPEKAGAAGTSIPFIVENAAYLYRSTRRVRCS